jgi:hypothetical protein
MTYWHLREVSGAMDSWHELMSQARVFTSAVEAQLGAGIYEDDAVKTYFWAKIGPIVAGLDATLVTARDDPLLMLKRQDFTFVYCSLMKHGLHTGVWMAVPADHALNPKIMCCFLHQARTQKMSEWVLPDASDLRSLVDCGNRFNLS